MKENEISKSKNTSLNRAKIAREDEFYTKIENIERELMHYKTAFKDKTIFCNCDDPYESNFFKHFANGFNHLELKKLIATCYDGSPIAGSELLLFDYEPYENKTTKNPHKIIITEVTDGNQDGQIDLSDVEYLLRNKKNALSRLKGNGDFRSTESIEFLKEADIVVTNPPFSLFREFVAQLMKYEKKFIIIGSLNAVTYREIFHLLKDNKIWLGYHSGDMEFIVPDYYQPREVRYREENGIKYRSMGNICWFTNIDIPKRHQNITLYEKYTPEKFPHYDNWDAINVSRVMEIPLDWDGVMGVPITFIEKHNPDQFEILDLTSPNLNGKTLYKRFMIRRIGGMV